MTPTRPVLRWHGGKWRLAPWILAHLPRHRRYTESYGGAGSVLIRKPRVYSEVYNDLDDGVVGLFRILRDPPGAAELTHRLALTPFARREFEESYEVSADPIEEARRLIVRSFMGFGSNGHNREVTTGFRAQSRQSASCPSRDWANYPTHLQRIVERVRDVAIENRPAVDVLLAHDGTDCLHYVDPPYLPETRSLKSRRTGGRYHAYAHELTTADHVDLLGVLRGLRGMVVLSGYPAPLYDDALPGWPRFDTVALADGARERTESLWLNPAAADALAREGRAPRQGCLLSAAE